ncbi:S-layer homology domain-containing protein [Anaeromicrobium sediminis]|uniref:SLH domain-containing protein n=1 Tax=Anaeromicrobium sediminis TaxID=1478221 RepID=A0A267MAM3_9FIRM|nr:S-layer homology domain-containing protein [Anaeromicrobium sediminis]PAB56634.1 hypothetical protein CCE28_20595 [Anaeromicrobium sediminis]
MEKRLWQGVVLLVFVIMICNIISPTYFVNAEDNVIDKIQWRGLGHIDDWVIDIENKYIYAIRGSSSWIGRPYNDTLIIVDTKEFKVVNEVELGGNAVDVEMEGNKLYFTLIDKNTIVEYDISTKSISNEIAVEEKPSSLSVYNGKIFYGTKMGYDSAIYVYDILKKTNEKIIVKDGNSIRRHYNPKLSIDENTGILYTSDIYLHGIDTNNYNIVYESKESDGGKGIIIDGNNVLYGHNNYDLSLDMINGKYIFYKEENQILHGDKITNVLHVNDKYVFTEWAIFNRHNFVKVKDLPFQATHVITDGDYVYMYINERYSARIEREKISSLEEDTNTKWSGKELTEWVLDEDRGYIYGISKWENRLLFINKDTLEIEDELIIFSDPTDIKLDNGKLYIALSGSNKISVIDIATKSVYKEIKTEYRPYKLAKYGEKIYYTEEGLAPMHEYDLTNDSEKSFVANSERIIVKVYRDAQILIDNDKGIMYVGTDDLHAIDLKNYSLLRATGDHHYGSIGDWSDKVFIQGGEIFYGRKRLDKDNMHIKGTYYETIVCVKDDYILSNSAVYDKKSFLKIGDLPFKSFLTLMDSNHVIYYHDRFTDSIKKMDLKSISLEKPVNYYNSQAELPVDMEIKNWMYSEKNDCIYAISTVTGKLLTIDPKNLTIKNERYVGEKPFDMDIYDNKIYITLKGESKIAIIDDMHRGKISKISTDVRPHQIQVDDKNIYYTGGYFLGSDDQKIYVYDREKDYSYAIGDEVYHRADLLIDRDNEILYIGNEGFEKLIGLSTKDYTVVKKYKSSENNSNENQLFKNDEYLFWGKFQVKTSDMTSGPFHNNQVVHVNGKYAYTKKGIDAYEFYYQMQIVDFPFDPDLVLTSTDGEVYLYKYRNNTIYKYPSKYEIDIKLNDSLKIDLNDKGQFVFSWDEVPNAIGYNLWYGTDRKMYISKVSDTIKDNHYVSKRDFTRNHGRVVAFGVTPIMKEASYDIVKIDMKDVDIEKFVSIKTGTNGEQSVDENSIDLRFISKFFQVPVGDLETVGFFNIDETLFNYGIEKLDKNKDTIELNTDLDYDRFHVKLSAGIYHNLYEKEKDKKLKINTPRGKYIWPISLTNLSEITVNPKTSSMDISIRREFRKNLEKITHDMFNLNLSVIGEPIRFMIEGLTEEANISVDTFSKGEFQCWIPLEEEADKSELVGMFYDLKTEKYKEVPTKFRMDSEGKWWAVFDQNTNGTYFLVKHGRIFKDVKNHWAEDDINLLASNLIVSGMPDGRFMPDKDITRAQYVTMLINALGVEPKIDSNDSSKVFKDVEGDEWFAQTVKTAVDLGLVTGYGDKTFRPNKLISREEMSVIIVKALKLLEVGKSEGNEEVLKYFKDSKNIGAWAKESATIAVENGLIRGDEKGFFNPKDYATRAQCAVVTKKLLEKAKLIEE